MNNLETIVSIERDAELFPESDQILLDIFSQLGNIEIISTNSYAIALRITCDPQKALLYTQDYFSDGCFLLTDDCTVGINIAIQEYHPDLLPINAKNIGSTSRISYIPLNWVRIVREAISENRIFFTHEHFVYLMGDIVFPEASEILLRLKGKDKIYNAGLFITHIWDNNSIMFDLDRLVIENALKAVSNNPQQYISVNISRFGIENTQYINQIIDIGETNPLVEHLIFEIPESKLSPQAITNIKSLSDRGYLIAIDDLGARSSNLYRITEVNPHIIKIDRLLTAKIEQKTAQSIISAILGIATDIGSTVIIEGIETKETEWTIMDIYKQCHAKCPLYGQGWLYL